MSRWVAATSSVVVRRADPNTVGAWTCAVVAAVVPVVDLRLLVLAPGLLLVLVPAQVLIGVLSAAIDDREVQRRLGRRLAPPLLAAVTPLLYLLVRAVREKDPRAGRPFWSAVALGAGAFLVNAFVNIAAYAAVVHGF